jgi:hypothetical protein
MVKGGIAKQLEGEDGHEVLLDVDGKNTEERIAFALGLPTRYMMARPDKFTFVDEVGSNPSTTKDGNVGGEKFLCEAGARPQVRAATKDSHFTGLGLTMATGMPLNVCNQLCCQGIGRELGTWV